MQAGGLLEQTMDIGEVGGPGEVGPLADPRD